MMDVGREPFENNRNELDIDKLIIDGHRRE